MNVMRRWICLMLAALLCLGVPASFSQSGVLCDDPPVTDEVPWEDEDSLPAEDVLQDVTVSSEAATPTDLTQDQGETEKPDQPSQDMTEDVPLQPEPESDQPAEPEDLVKEDDDEEDSEAEDGDDQEDEAFGARSDGIDLNSSSGKLSLELHTGHAWQGKGNKINAGKTVYRVNLSKDAAALFSVESIVRRTFRIYPIKTGSAKMTVEYTDGSKRDVTVTIYSKYTATGLDARVNGPRDGSTLFMTKAGATMTVQPILTPATATTAVYYKSSNTRVARVSANGTLTLLKTGSFTLTVTTANGLRKVMKLKVVNPYTVKSFSLTCNGNALSGTKTRTWSTRDKLQLGYNAVTVGGKDYKATGKGFSWSSSSKKIASISAGGVVTVHKAGTVTFTLKGPNGKKLKAKFKFVQPLTGITITPSTSVEVMPGKTVQLKTSLKPSSASGLARLSWYSGNTKIATVDQKGIVTGVKAGTVYIYCKDTVTGITARKSVVVTAPPVYRAIVSVQGTDLSNVEVRHNGSTYYLHGYMARSADQSMIVKTLGMQKYNGQGWSVKQLHNSSASSVLKAIDSVAAKANSHDVTMFFFMGHGLADGSLYFYNGTHITPTVLKQHLDKVPGKVIVMLGSCNSGRYVSKAVSGAGFTDAIMAEFAVGDTVPVTVVESNGVPKAVTAEMLAAGMAQGDQGFTPKSGELRSSKYYVLTASAASQNAWSVFTIKSIDYARRKLTVDESESYSYFVRGVSRSGGWDGIDGKKLWSSGQRTLAQVYSAVYQYCRPSGGNRSKVQVYPKGSSFVIFSH